LALNRRIPDAYDAANGSGRLHHAQVDSPSFIL
jgi:hypothetical protein